MKTIRRGKLAITFDAVDGEAAKWVMDRLKGLLNATYGTTLKANNGRDALRDAYEEALDLAVYLKQVMIERRGK